MSMLDHELAPPGTRLIAQFIDSLIAITAFILLIFLAANLSGAEETVVTTVESIGLLCAILYILCADGLKCGQSYGKRVMGICVIDATSGSPCTFLKSLIRNISLSLLGIIDWVFIFSERRQRLGDMIANTIVVRKRPHSRVY